MVRSVNDSKRSFLESVGYFMDRIESLERVLQAEEARKTGVSAIDYSKEQYKGGTGGGSLDYLIDSTDKYKRDIIKACTDLTKRKLEILECINAIPNPKYALLLTLRYIERLDWYQIEDIMKLTTNSRNVYHAQALSAVQVPEVEDSLGC